MLDFVPPPLQEAYAPSRLVFSRRPQECASDYQEMVADKCVYCSRGIRRGGGFSGSFYPIDRKLGDSEGEEGEAKVHLECFEAYQAKLAEERDDQEAAAPETETTTGDKTAADAAAAAAATAVANPAADAETETRVETAVEEAGEEAVTAKESN